MQHYSNYKIIKKYMQLTFEVMQRKIENWKNIILKSKKSEIISIYEMESNEECWNDWINCDNEYFKNDKKAIDAGACKYLNFIAIVLKKK